MCDKDDIFIRKGNASVVNDAGDVDPTRSIIFASKIQFAISSKVENTIVADPQKVQTLAGFNRFQNEPAMKLLEGKNFTLVVANQDPINLGIGNIWQAPVPDKDFYSGSLSGSSEILIPQDENTAFVLDCQYANINQIVTVTKSDLDTSSEISCNVPPFVTKTSERVSMEQVTVTVYPVYPPAKKVSGLLYQDELEFLSSGETDESGTTVLTWKSENDLDLGKGFDKIEVYVDAATDEGGKPTGDPTYTMVNSANNSLSEPDGDADGEGGE